MRAAQLLGVFAALAGATLSLVGSVRSSGPKGNAALFWEAENALHVRAPFEVVRDPNVLAGSFVQLVGGQEARELSYEVEIEETGDYALWARVKWLDGCRNSLLVTVNGDQSKMLGNDALYDSWHWVRGGTYKLRKGVNNVAVDDINPIEDNRQAIQLDQLLLTNKTDDAVRTLFGEAGQASPDMSFSDDFMGDWTKSWTSLGGDWHVSGLAWHMQQRGGEPAFLLIENSDWGDYSLAVATRIAPRGARGLVFGYRGKQDYWLALLVGVEGRTTLELVRAQDGAVRVLAREPVSLQPGAWTRLRVEVLGREVQLLLNEHSWIRITSTSVVGRVGLYSDAAGGALFDDVEVRPTNAFSESSYVGHSRQFIALSSQSFDEVGELAEWGVSGGQWRVEDGSLRGSGPGKPVIVNRGVYSGEFQIEFEVRLIPGQSLLLHTDGVQGRQSFLLEPRHDEVQVGAFLGVESIGAVTSHFEGERARFRLRRMESRYRLDLDNRDLLDVPALDRGPIVFSFEAAGESVSVDSFHVSQIPLYLYNPWDAPVGWGPSRGTIGMGHAFVYAHAEGDEAAIWHDEAFGCRDWLYSPILAIRADAPFGSWIELVLCHQEGADSRDIAVRYQLVDKPKLFQSGSTREAQLTLRRGQQVLGRAAVELAVDRTGFVALNLEVRSAELGTFVFVDDAPVIEVENLEPSGAGKLGFRFSYGKGGMPGQLGVLFFSIYPGASEDAEDARPNAETGPMRDATPAAAQPSAALHR